MSAAQTTPMAEPETFDSAARLMVLAVGIAVAITAADPTILAGNLGKIVSGLHVTVERASFIAGLATLTSAAATLGAGIAGAVINFSMGGIVVAISYWVTLVKGEPSTVAGLILMPAAAAQGGASVLGGWLMSRVTARSIMISGLAIIVVSCLGLAGLGITAYLMAAAGWLSLLAVGWGLAQTPQSDIMMSYASPESAGSVSAARSGIGQTFYALGPTVYALVIMSLFVTQASDKLVEQGISKGSARAALRIVPAPTEGQLRRASPIDPEGAHRTVASSEYAMTPYKQ